MMIATKTAKQIKAEADQVRGDNDRLLQQLQHDRNGHHAGNGTAPAQPPASGDYKRIPLEQLRPSPTNPRKHFDAAELAELAKTIEAHGVLEPLVARAHADRLFEIVCGERRWRAAKLAKAIDVPVMVRKLSDREVREIQVIENDQRSDTTDVERAHGYQGLIADGMTVAELAGRVGKSEATIYAILRLGRVPKAIAKAIEAGTVSRSVAELICRLPSPAMRELAGECVLLGCRNPDQIKHYRRSADEPLSFRQTKELIEDDFTRQLSKAPFKTEDAELVPKAGACSSCPKRAGNNRADFPDGREDTCADVDCYRAKSKAARDQREAEAKRLGLKVLPAKQCEQLFQGGTNFYSSTYVDASNPCYDVGSGRKSWKSLLKSKHEDLVTLAHDGEGKPVELYDRSQATKALRSLKLIKPQPKIKSYRVGGNSAAAGKKSGFTSEVRARIMGAACAQVDAVIVDNKEPLADITVKTAKGLRMIELFRAIALEAARQMEFAVTPIDVVDLLKRYYKHDSGKFETDLIEWSAIARVEELISFTFCAMALQESIDCLDRPGSRDAIEKERDEIVAGFGRLDWKALEKQATSDLEAEAAHAAPKAKKRAS